MAAELVALSQLALGPVLLQSVSITNAAGGTTGFIDLTGFDGVVAIVVNVGAGALTTTVDESTDGSTAAVTGSTNVSGVGAILTGASQVILIDVRKVKQYIRVVPTGVTNPTVVSYTLVGFKKYRP